MWYYLLQYILFLLVFNITAIFNRPVFLLTFFPNMLKLGNTFFLIHIPFSYLLVKFQIINKLNKRKDYKYNDIKIKLMIYCGLINVIFVVIFNFLTNQAYANFSNIIAFIVSPLLFIYILKPENDKIEEETRKEIENYFDNKKL